MQNKGLTLTDRIETDLMSYTPLVNPDSIAMQANPFARSPAINNLFNRCYGSDILPSRSQFPRSFRHEDVFANLYLSDRQWVDEVDFAPEQASERHEQYLDELFWSPNVTHPLICVLGAVGSGKSTLVDYYLRCYCGTKGRNRAEFDKKLIVHFDSKVIQDNTDFYHDFFLFASHRSAINAPRRALMSTWRSSTGRLSPTTCGSGSGLRSKS